MKLEDALGAAPGGVRLDLEVTPGASVTRFPAGYNPWRKRIEARVAAPAHEGRANEELAGAMADFFGRPRRDVQVTAGAASRQKRVLVRGIGLEEALLRLRAALKTPP